MTKTVLEMVQGILVDLNGDEITSISDTEESEQVASHLKRVYENLMSNSNWPHTRRMIQLVASGDSEFPTHMTLPSNVKSMISIMYNKQKLDAPNKDYKKIEYKEPDAFMMKLNVRNSSSDTVEVVVDPSGVELLIKNDKAPDYYTSFDDTTVVFDSYDSEVDSTLQNSKTQSWAYIMPDFTVNDSFVPDLPPDLYSLLIEETISRVMIKMAERPDGKSEQESLRHRRWASRQAWRVSSKDHSRNYGRKK